LQHNNTENKFGAYLKEHPPLVHQLSNGLKIVYKQMFSTLSTQCGFVINAGSADDGEHPGLAHCFEHLLFKGTKKRNSTQVLSRLEVVGGELNAFTGKDITAIYANVLTKDFKRAAELLGDIVFNPNFKESDLVKEKRVIKDEINLYLDTPEENIFDEFQQFHYPTHPMGYNILGDEKSLEKINCEIIYDFWQKYYTTENMVFSIVTNLSFDNVLKNLSFLAEIRKEKTNLMVRIAPIPSPVFKKEVKTDHTQVYACIGCEAYPYLHPKKEGLMLLNNILGGPGMNSRLNMAVREKHGLTYQIDSNYTAYHDCGLFYLSYSTEKKYLNKINKIVAREMQKLAENKLGKLQLQQAKNQFIGQLLLGEENKIALMVFLAKSTLFYKSIENLATMVDKISAISEHTLQEIAQETFTFSKQSSLLFIPNA